MRKPCFITRCVGLGLMFASPFLAPLEASAATFRSGLNRLIQVGVGSPIYTTVVPPSSGRVEAPSSVAPGTIINLHAIPSPGFVFSHWVLNGGPSVDQNPASVTVNGPLTAQATFVVGVTASVEGDGSILGDNVVSIAGQPCSFVAVPGMDADFLGWFAGDILLTTTPDLSFVSDGTSQHVTARFVIKPVYRTQVTVDPPYAGSFDGSAPQLDLVTYRDRMISFTAYPWPGFAFRGWQRNGEWVSDQPSISFAQNGDSVWSAQLEPTAVIALVSFHTNTPQRLVVTAGTNVALVCDWSYNGWMDHSLRWRRGKRVLSEAQRSILLTNVKPSDTGVYRFSRQYGRTKFLWTSTVRLKVIKPRESKRQ